MRPHGRWYDGVAHENGSSVQISFRLSPAGVMEAYKELLDKSVEILEPPTDQDFGQKTPYFRDPEGNIIEIYAEL